MGFLSGFVLSLLLIGSSFAAVSEDLITELPGADFEITFKQYSGYLQGSPDDHLHYWFTESQNDPVNDPLLVWMNGGPGCSSLLGLLTELGPLRTLPDGSGVKENPYAWNLVANVLFLEAPRCVGFSYSDSGSCDSSDDSTSLSNYLALQDFFLKYPEYRGNEFYISGESYAGIYIPTLSVRVLDGNDTFPTNFKGFAIGNGLLSYPQNDNSLMFYGSYHALLSQSLWDNMVDACCVDNIADQDHCDFQYYNDNTLCNAELTRAYQLMYYDGLNMYNLYEDCSTPEQGQSSPLLHPSRREVSLSNMFRSLPKSIHQEKDEPPCLDDSATETYLNDPAVRAALHIPSTVQEWAVCAGAPFTYVRQYDDVFSQLRHLTSGTLRALIYNGDCDMACNVIGNTWGVETLGLNVTDSWSHWIEPNTDQVAGFRKRFKNLDFVTIRGAGHMVPENRPVEALQMITAFLLGKDYD